MIFSRKLKRQIEGLCTEIDKLKVNQRRLEFLQGNPCKFDGEKVHHLKGGGMFGEPLKKSKEIYTASNPRLRNHMGGFYWVYTLHNNDEYIDAVEHSRIKISTKK